MIGFQLQVPQN